MLSGCTYYPFGRPNEPPAADYQAPPPRHVATHARSPAQPSPQRPARAAPANIAQASTTVDGLIGLTERQVQQRFGSPAAREERKPGTAWIYRDADCRLEVSFYPDVRTHDYKALGYEVKSNADTNAGKSRCTSRFASRVAAK
jgi:hypothetical protein